MGEKTNTKKKLRFWRKGKKDGGESRIKGASSAPMLDFHVDSPMKSKTKTNAKSRPPRIQEKRRVKTEDGSVSKYRRNGPLEDQTSAPPPPSDDSKPTPEGMRRQSTHRTHPTTPQPQSQAQPSPSYTPKTLPPTPSPPRSTKASPSPSPKWQESDQDKKIKAMARLHSLAKEHAMSEGVIPAALRSLPDEPSVPIIHIRRDQSVIDAVLGINPCVPIETKKVIRTYASSPTSPATIVNLQMLKEGGSKVFSLARDGVVKMMSCAADLQDLKEGNDLCFHDYTKMRKANSLYKDFYDDDVSTDDEGTCTGLSVDGRNSPVSHLESGISTDEVESLGEALGRMDTKLPATAAAAGTGVGGRNELKLKYDDVGMEEHRMPIMRVSSSRRAAEINRRANSLGAQHLQPQPHIASGATSGLTSFRSLTNNRPRDSSGSPGRKLSKADVINANPITSNIPFDERSDVYEYDDVCVPVDLYGSSAFGDGPPGRHLQLGEGNVYMAGSDTSKNFSKTKTDIFVSCGSDRGI
jgi:hypothetical protein